MQVMLELSDDVVKLVRQRALLDDISLEEAMSRLIRQGVNADEPSAAAAGQARSRYTVLAERDEIITTEHVRRLATDAGI